MLKVIGATALTLALLGLARSQEKPDDKKPAPQLPAFYKKLNLTEEQKEKIFKIRADAKKKVDALALEIKKIWTKEKADNEAVLTPEQRKLLHALRTGEKLPTETSKTPAKTKPK
jgi:Spy/CpxP family protein refolding chaperone